MGGSTPSRPFSPQQPTNDVFQTTPVIATTPGYASTGYPSAGRPSGPAFVTSGASPGFPGSAPGTLPPIGFDDGYAGSRPNLPGATASPFPGATGPSSSFPTGPNYVSPSAPQGTFGTIAPAAPGSRPLVPGTRPTGPGFGGNQNNFGSSAPGSQGGFGTAPGSTGGFGTQPGSSGFGGQSGQGGSSGSSGSSNNNNGQYEGGDYSAIPGEPGVDYPIYTEIPKTSFDCINQQWPGYYADVEAQCQVFHICALNRTYDFLCPNGTIFSQQHLVCVWWNQFDCNSAPGLYGNNAYIYDYSQQGQQQTTIQNQPTPQVPVGPSTSFGGNNGPSGPATGFGGNRGPTGPTTSFGGNKGPTGPSTSFGGNTGATGPSVIGQPGTGPSSVYPGATGPASSYPGVVGPVGPTAVYPGAQGSLGPAVNYPTGGQGPSAGGVYPGSAPGSFPGSVGPTATYPGSTPAVGYPSATTPAFGGYPSSDQLYPSPSPPNREYLPPTRI